MQSNAYSESIVVHQEAIVYLFSTMKKLFFALWPDQETRTKLAEIISSLDILELKPVRVDSIHVTLVFLGLVEEEKIAEIRQKAAEIPARPFSIIFDQLHYWQKPKVLCLRSSSQSAPEILHLAGNLKQMVADFRIEMDKRAYVPHVTLAKKAQTRSYLDFEPIRWSAESFSLVESITEPEGLYYKVVQSWSLNQ